MLRWFGWFRTTGAASDEDLRVDRFLLIHSNPHRRLVEYVAEDIASVSPETSVEPRLLDFKDPWDFEEVYGKLLDFARAEPLDPDT